MFFVCVVTCNLLSIKFALFAFIAFIVYAPLLLPLFVKAYGMLWCLKIGCEKCCGFLYKILLMITELRPLSRIGNIDDQRNVKCSTDCCSSQHNGFAELGWGVTQT